MSNLEASPRGKRKASCGEASLRVVQRSRSRVSSLQQYPNQYEPQEYYAQKVASYSKLDSYHAYFSGIHYTRLAKFLISPYKFYGNDWEIEIPGDGFHYVALCDLNKEREDPDRTKYFSRPDELTPLLDSPDPHPKKEVGAEDGNEPGQGSNDIPNWSQAPNTQHARQRFKHLGRIVFLRGFPSPQWLNHLGAAFDIDPELLSRHLDVSAGYIPNALRLDCPYSTPFPKTRDLIQLRVCNTGSWNTTRSNAGLAALREGCEKSMKQHIDDFTGSRNIAVGDSIVRRFMLHSLESFSIEQTISIEVIYHTRTWSSKLLDSAFGNWETK